jgi:hypothetical protein
VLEDTGQQRDVLDTRREGEKGWVRKERVRENESEVGARPKMD